MNKAEPPCLQNQNKMTLVFLQSREPDIFYEASGGKKHHRTVTLFYSSDTKVISRGPAINLKFKFRDIKSSDLNSGCLTFDKPINKKLICYYFE